MHRVVLAGMCGRSESDRLEAWQLIVEDFGGVVLELVKLADGHGRVAGDSGFNDEPVPSPPHPKVVNGVDTGY